MTYMVPATVVANKLRAAVDPTQELRAALVSPL
jgi:hypothetical protein